MFYEVIYEDGTHSIASYDNDEEMLRAVKEHHRRAMSGEPALPAEQSAIRSDVTDAGNPLFEIPATRVKKVLRYAEHPAARDGFAELDKAAVTDMLAQSKNMGELVAALRDFDNPTTATTAHESNYKMTEDEEFGEDSWQ